MSATRWNATDGYWMQSQKTVPIRQFFLPAHRRKPKRGKTSPNPRRRGTSRTTPSPSNTSKYPRSLATAEGNPIGNFHSHMCHKSRLGRRRGGKRGRPNDKRQAIAAPLPMRAISKNSANETLSRLPKNDVIYYPNFGKALSSWISGASFPLGYLPRCGASTTQNEYRKAQQTQPVL